MTTKPKTATETMERIATLARRDPTLFFAENQHAHDEYRRASTATA